MANQDLHEPVQPAERVDPVVADADRRAERAKASLRARIAELEQRFGDIRERLDVPEHIRAHPWPAVGVALALGVLAGRRGSPIARAATAERSLGSTALAALIAIGLRVGRELVLGQIGRAARQWWVEHGGDEADYYDAIDVTPGRR